MTRRCALIVPTGTANLASVISALVAAGAEPRLAERPEDLLDAYRVVLPGVGAMQAAMARLSERGFTEPLKERLESGRPFLGICLGLQLLAEQSEESPGARGLSLLPGKVTRLRAEGVRVPHIGWNHVEPGPDCRLLQAGAAYFAHSFRLERAPAGFAAATAQHGDRFVAALERGPQLACQFHPELSGEYGLSLLSRWLRA